MEQQDIIKEELTIQFYSRVPLGKFLGYLFYELSTSAQEGGP